jgi:hypothetical protein
MEFAPKAALVTPHAKKSRKDFEIGHIIFTFTFPGNLNFSDFQILKSSNRVIFAT